MRPDARRIQPRSSRPWPGHRTARGRRLVFVSILTLGMALGMAAGPSLRNPWITLAGFALGVLALAFRTLTEPRRAAPAAAPPTSSTIVETD